MEQYYVTVTPEYTSWFSDPNCTIHHRLDGPAVIDNAVPYTAWCKNGKYHRTDGPAVEYPGRSKSWHVDGLRHRTDGPALEWSNGDKNGLLMGWNILNLCSTRCIHHPNIL